MAKECSALTISLSSFACGQVRVGKWLTDLEKNFYGSSLAYDKVRPCYILFILEKQELVDIVFLLIFESPKDIAFLLIFESSKAMPSEMVTCNCLAIARSGIQTNALG